jgi:hypothetical protein
MNERQIYKVECAHCGKMHLSLNWQEAWREAMNCAATHRDINETLNVLAQNVMRNNALYHQLKAGGQIVAAPERFVDQDFTCVDCGHDDDRCVCADDEPDYLGEVRCVARETRY